MLRGMEFWGFTGACGFLSILLENAALADTEPGMLQPHLTVRSKERKMRTISLGISGIAAALSLATLSIPATAAIPPRPGVVNYVEGNASIDGRTITVKDVGTAALDRNQVLRTEQGKVEVLLSPGVFLRLSGNAELRMVSPELTNTSVELVRGEAMVEADDLLKENHVTILSRGATTTLVKNGLYSFNADLGVVSVYKGEASVREEDRTVTVKEGKDVNVSG